jgi:putative membrane protein
MKEVTLRFFGYLAILYLVDAAVAGFDLTLPSAAIILALLLSITFLVLNPAIKFFTLPLNLVTLGFFSFLISCLYLYFFNFIIPGYYISDGSIGPVTGSLVQIPQIQLSLVAVVIISSMLISLLNNIVTWSLGKK